MAKECIIMTKPYNNKTGGESHDSDINRKRNQRYCRNQCTAFESKNRRGEKQCPVLSTGCSGQRRTRAKKSAGERSVRGMKCPNCHKQIQEGNFCEMCGAKLKDICDCWVKKEPYNCRQEKCPGYRLLVEEKLYS